MSEPTPEPAPESDAPAVEVLYDKNGQPWQPSSAIERTRLLSAGYSVTPPFKPEEHTAEEVAAHVAEHPEEADQVLAAEAAGKARKTALKAGE